MTAPLTTSQALAACASSIAAGAPAQPPTARHALTTGSPLESLAMAVAPVPSRPVLTRAARLLWRDHGTLQFGRPPGPAHILSGLDAGARTALTLLDGTRRVQDVTGDAAAAGCPPARTGQLLQLLADAGLLEDGSDSWPDPPAARAERERLLPDIRSLALATGGSGLPALGDRARAKVTVLGAGRVGAPLAGLLSSSGVGVVDVRDDQPARPSDVGLGAAALADVGRSRGGLARQALSVRALSVRDTADSDMQTPDLVILAPVDGDDAHTAHSLGRAGVPHLLATVRGRVGVVGPLVLPGSSACLRCLDLTRTDLDPSWPALAAQLSVPRREVEACDSSLALAVAAHAALQVLCFLSQGHRDQQLPATVSGTLELTLPDWRWRRRSWPVHPDCDCAWDHA